jgi:putative transposase
MTEELSKLGIHDGQRRVGHLMQQNGADVIRNRKFKGTTDSDHGFDILRSHSQQDFTASRPNRKCSANITNVWTRMGWGNLVLIIDPLSLHGRMGHQKPHEERSGFEGPKHGNRDPQATAGLHCSHGSRIAILCPRLPKVLCKHWLEVSMSGNGNCYDNSGIEGFFKSLQAELVWRRNGQARREVEVALSA